ncbi:2-acylglycerol O-acyltransferase 3 [Tupaia chinensis]|uniref:Acyltransferase n=1 Tax=Tupaia chinensis TaxID=246437 RepID=L9K1D0_TUPCH|nr:2-acylglycerol O-acyltransferase 3 [Tupaia chinensis]
MDDSTALPPSVPAKPRWKQWLEAVGIFQYVLTFLFMGLFFSCLVIFLLFTRFWFISVFYLTWLYLDWDTPSKGQGPETFPCPLLEPCWQRMDDSTALPPSVPAKPRWKQWLEAVGIFQYVLTFLFMGLFFSCLVIFLLFTRFWFISVFYLTWLYLDWDTPSKGGRRYEWLRNQTVWKHLRDYFPIKLVKTAELPPDRNYVLGSHPHGILLAGSFCNFGTEGNGCSQHFPGLRLSMAALAILFYLPVYREYLMCLGARPVSRESLDFLLSQPKLGQAVVIMVGGAHEALYAIPGEHCLTLKKRKGFVRLALRHGASLVPVYTFGENDIFRLKAFATDTWQYWCQVTFKKLVGFSPCIFWGRGLFSANSWGLLPFSVPITTVVGRPIPVPQCLDPTQEEVDHYHTLYMRALEQLFEEHKESCGVPASTCLTFI